jgi:hypothetical protein
MHVVSSYALLQMIKSKCHIWKNLIAFANDVRWIRRCIFEIAHVSHWTIFEAFFWIISISSIFFTDWLYLIDNVLIANVSFKKSFSLRFSCEIELHWRIFRRIDTSRKINRVFSQYRKSLRRLTWSSMLSCTCLIQSLAF